MHTPTEPNADDARRRWLALLAQAPRAELARQAPPIIADHRFDTLRPPEVGLVMLRARIGQHGDRFNIGETTVTRCVLRHRPTGGGAPTAGVGCVLGRDEERARGVAALDALLQVQALHPLLAAQVLAPLAGSLAAQRAVRQARVAASRVRFDTLQPEAAR